jgi:NH3-dependent NAD+ synthetase
MKEGKLEMYVLREEIGQRMRTFIKKVKDKVEIICRVKQTSGRNDLYLGLRPTVDIALVALLSHPVFQTNQVLPICMPGSSSIHIVTSLVNNRNNIT